MYGCLRGSLPTLREAQKHTDKWPWFYADNGYFKAGKTEESFFRVTRNGLQHDGRGENPDLSRWCALGLNLWPWRRRGEYVIVCPPSRLFASLMGFSADKWLEVVVARIKSATKRPIRVRMKMSWHEVKMARIPPLAEELPNAWALVTHSSNAAVEALVAGIPVFCTDPCAAAVMGKRDVLEIESPAYPADRERWAAVLANNQWTLPEMRDGTCWRMLKGEA